MSGCEEVPDISFCAVLILKIPVHRYPSFHKLRAYAADKDKATELDKERCNKFAKSSRGMTEGELWAFAHEKKARAC